MSLEMQRLYLKEIEDELANLHRILFDDNDKVNEETENKLREIHDLLNL